MPQSIDLVDRHQRRLLDIIGAARPLITGSVRDTDEMGLRYLRQEMVEALASYARLVGELADGAAGSGDEGDAPRMAQLRDRCLSMGVSYDDFCRRWAQRAPYDNWPEYGLSAVHMMKRIRDDVLASR